MITQQKTNKYEIRLPSNVEITKESIWKFMKTISITGDTFSKEHLLKNNLYTKSDDMIGRVLSYLKYLGFIDELREMTKTDGKVQKLQKFTIQKNTMIKDIQYELKAGRDEKAKENLKKHISVHQLYLAIKEDFFGTSQSKTFVDLEFFLKQRPELSDKSPTYYQNGGKFIMDFLSFLDLVRIEGSDIKLVQEDMQLIKEELQEESLPTDQVPSLPTDISSFRIIISGPSTNYDFLIKEEDDFTIIEAILKKIKNKVA
jgi:hypothetical protein